MAHRRVVLVVTVLAALAASLSQLQGTALAAGLDEKGEADAKQATRLYKQGQYQGAAEIFARLSVDYPDMPIFDRNLGACFYHLRKPEPALSNLRRYLGRRQDIAPDDKAVVDRWIDEMEQLRAQNAAASAPSALPPVAPTPQPPPAAAPSPAAAQAPLAPVAPPPKAEEPAPAIPAAASIPPAVPAPSEAPKPAGVDLAAGPVPADSTEAGSPYYKTWWFWTGAAVVVVGGAVAAIYFATRSNDPCNGASMACLGVK